MFAVTISMRAKDLTGAAILREASLAVVAPSQAESCCLFFDVLFDPQDPLLLRFYEAYEDKVSFEAHLKAPHTQSWAQVCMPLVDKSSIRMPESVSERG